MFASSPSAWAGSGDDDRGGREPAHRLGAHPARPQRVRRGCGSITAAGCCSKGVLFYCERGSLMRIVCHRRPSCGWRTSGIYDCGTSGAGDPTDAHPKLCLFEGKKPPHTPAAPDDCRGITEEGCCDGQRLRFCEEGQLQTVDCQHNPRCGWRPGAQLYNCGTQGKGDPRGRYPRRCPGRRSAAHPTSSRSSAGKKPERRSPPAASASDAGAHPEASAGCGCNAVSRPPLLSLLALALLPVARRRRPRS